MVGAQLVVDLAEGAGARDLVVEPDKQVLDIYPAGLPGPDPLAGTDPPPGTDPATTPADPPTTEASREAAPGATEAESATTETAPASLTPMSTGELPDTTVELPDEPMVTHSAPAIAWPHFSELAIDSVARCRRRCGAALRLAGCNSSRGLHPRRTALDRLRGDERQDRRRHRGLQPERGSLRRRDPPGAPSRGDDPQAQLEQAAGHRGRPRRQ